MKKIEEILENEASKEDVIIMRDFSRVVGEGQDRGKVGQFGLGSRNERGENWVNFAAGRSMQKQLLGSKATSEGGTHGKGQEIQEGSR